MKELAKHKSASIAQLVEHLDSHREGHTAQSKLANKNVLKNCQHSSVGRAADL